MRLLSERFEPGYWIQKIRKTQTFVGVVLVAAVAAGCQTSTPLAKSEQATSSSTAAAQDNEARTEQALRQTLAAQERSLGPDHPDVAKNLNSLTALYLRQGRFDEAEPLLKRSLAIQERSLGPDNPNVANNLNDLAALYFHQERYDEAEPLFKRSLAIRERSLGPDHLAVA